MTSNVVVSIFSPVCLASAALALALIVGALPGAHLGATTSRRLSPDTLARILGILLAFVAVQMWSDLVARLF